jgi:hypothetical protein
MNESTLIPDGRIWFEIPGSPRAGIDLIDAVEKVNEITAQNQGRVDFNHLTEWIAWFKEQSGVVLTRGQADWMMDFVRAEYARTKKSRIEQLASVNFTE